ncbi:MAG: DUF2490 domain-containing protein [Flavobacteriaceae bacterium]|nr:DUF2490 domain-containing protein [Flavobacteriaceae bacterium]
MKQFKKLLAGAVFCLISLGKAQDIDTHKSFITTGVSVKIPQKHSLKVFGGVSAEQHIQMLMITPNFKINNVLSFSPSYTMLDIPRRKGADYREHHLNLMATISIPLDKENKWILQNRNAYFHRFVEHGGDTNFYKGRIGIVHRTKLFDKSLNVFAHNEIYLSLKNGHLTRNRFYTGGEWKLFNWLTSQAMYIFQTNKGVKAHDHLFVVGAIVPLENFGFFKSK